MELSNLPAHAPVFVESGVQAARVGAFLLSRCMYRWATACSRPCPCLYSLWDSSSRCPAGWGTFLWSPWWPDWLAVCSTHNCPALNTGEAAVSGKGGWTVTGRREEEEKGSGGADGTAGTASGDWGNGAASAAVGCRSDASIVKKAGDLATPGAGSVAGSEKDAVANGDSVIGEAGCGLASAVGDLAIGEPAGKSAMAEPADDLEMVVLCGSSSEREKEAEVLACDIYVLANEDADLVSADAKAAAGDLAHGFAVNSGYALCESGSFLTCPSLCQICP